MRRRVVLLVVAIAIAMLGLVVGIAPPHSDAMPTGQQSTSIGAPHRDDDRRASDERARSRDAGERITSAPAHARSPGDRVRATSSRDDGRATTRSHDRNTTPPTDAPARDAEPDTRPAIVAVQPWAGTPLRDRIGGREDLVQALFHEFEPLAAECIDQAIDRSPDLRGMLAIEFSIAPDTEHGAIVEAVDPAAQNEVAEPELIECLRQTMLSAQLPATGEPDAVMITMPIGEAKQ